MIILFGLGLVILGPERLPKVAMQLGNWAGQARRMARSLMTQMRDELDVDLNQPFDADYSPPKRPAESYKRPGVDDLKPGGSDDGPEDHDDDADSRSGKSQTGDPQTADKPG